jgi:hypothetical protein
MELFIICVLVFIAHLKFDKDILSLQIKNLVI